MLAFFSRLLRRNQMLKDSGILAFGMIGAQLFNLLFQMVMGRTLNPEEFALLVMFLGVFNVVSLPLNVVSVSISRYTSLMIHEERIGDVRRLAVRWIVRMGLIGFGLTAVCCLFAGSIAVWAGMDRIAPVIIFATTLVGIFIRPVILGALTGLQRFGCWSVSNIFGAVVRVVTGAVLVWCISPYAGWGLLGNGTGFYGSIIIGAVFLWFFLRGAKRSGMPLPSIHGYMTGSLLVLLGYSFLMTGDVILVKRLFPDSAGDFAYSATLGRLVLLAPQALVGAMFPRVVGDRQSTTGQLGLFWKTMAATLLLAAAAAFVFTFFCGFFMHFIFPKTVVSAELIRWCRLLSWTLVPVALLNVAVRYVLAQHRLRIAMVVPIAAFCYTIFSYVFASGPDDLLYALNGVSLCALLVLLSYIWRQKPTAL